MPEAAPERFHAIASQYAASEVHASSPTIKRLHELIASKQEDSVCDVACGPGHLALSFAGKVSRIVGVDAAPNMLRQFERLAKERGINVETVCAYAESMPFPSASFDTVVSRLAPHHFRDPAEAIREMARLTRPGGRIAVIDLEGHEDPALDDFMHKLETLHDPSHVRSHTAAGWRKFFAANDLTIEALESNQTELPGGLAIGRWCEIGRTAPEAQSEIRALLAAAPKERLLALGIRYQDGEFRLPVRTLIIIGRKGDVEGRKNAKC